MPQPNPDIPMLVTVPSPSPSSNPNPLLSAERRINPTWTLSQLKAKLESMTGIPPSSQALRIRGVDGGWVDMDDEDGEREQERERVVGGWGLRRGGEIEVCDFLPICFWGFAVSLCWELWL